MLTVTVRIVEFAIDPHAAREILPGLADGILYDVPLILWVVAAFMLYLYWYFLFQRPLLISKDRNSNDVPSAASCLHHKVQTSAYCLCHHYFAYHIFC